MRCKCTNLSQTPVTLPVLLQEGSEKIFSLLAKFLDVGEHVFSYSGGKFFIFYHSQNEEKKKLYLLQELRLKKLHYEKKI